MPRTRKASHGRRAEVIDCAARIFFTKGYEAATIQDIADELGLLKGSLYYYIQNKEDVLYEIIRSYHDGTRSYFEEIVVSDAPVVDRLRQFIETETTHTAHELVKSSLFFTEWRSLNEERRADIVAERDRHDHFVRDCIVTAQEEPVSSAPKSIPGSRPTDFSAWSLLCTGGTTPTGRTPPKKSVKSSPISSSAASVSSVVVVISGQPRTSAVPHWSWSGQTRPQCDPDEPRGCGR